VLPWVVLCGIREGFWLSSIEMEVVVVEKKGLEPLPEGDPRKGPITRG